VGVHKMYQGNQGHVQLCSSPRAPFRAPHTTPQGAKSGAAAEVGHVGGALLEVGAEASAGSRVYDGGGGCWGAEGRSQSSDAE